MIQYKEQEGAEGIKERSGFELGEADARDEEKEIEKGGLSPSQGSEVTFWRQPAVHEHMWQCVTDAWMRNKI